MRKGIIRYCFVAFLLICLTISIISPNVALAQPATFTDSGQTLGSGYSNDIALGDLDSDGDLDAFIANYGETSMTEIVPQPNRVWLNDGSGIFTDSLQDLGDSGSRGVALGDFDSDGDLDAFVANSLGELGLAQPNKVWLNDGSGTFTDSGQDLGSLNSYDVALGDLDTDGDLDAFVANWGCNRVWLNDGSGTFTDSGQCLGGAFSNGVALGDLDSDGDLDAFVANGPGDNKVWLNDGSGNFTDSGQDLGTFGESVALGDLDSDGDLDAWILRSSDWDRVWLNDGSGTFTNSSQSLGEHTEFDNDVALGDLDSDGDLDAFLAYGAGNKVWLNDSSGTFTDSGQTLGGPTLGDSWSEAVALGDLDSDGDLDAFVANDWADGQPNKVWLNLSPSQCMCFTDSGQSTEASESQYIALGDLDGDGDLDAFVANQVPQPNKVYLNSGTGIFTDSLQALGSSKSYDVALGDLDKDGDLDAFVGNGPGADKVWFNDGSGIFSDSGQSLGTPTSTSVALGDLDKDGDLDAFVAIYGSDEPNEVWVNDGSGGFTDSGQTLGSSDSFGVALGDLDSDGDLDAFVANAPYGGPPGANRVWVNDGSGGFTDSGQALGGNTYSFDVALGDLDSDGDLDACVANSSFKPSRIWLNDGSGGFTDSGQTLDSDMYGVALGDLDGDGDLDAFLASSGCSEIWINDGLGNFTDSGHCMEGSSDSGVALGDIDSDGDLDAFVANTSHNPSKPNKVWENSEVDFGDAPEDFGINNKYKTSLANDGARHLITDLYLGNSIDCENDGQPDANALGDDNNGNADEDGVFFTNDVTIGEMAEVDVIASADGYLNVWMDFNADGDWKDTNEHILTDQLLSTGTNSLSFPVPADAAPGLTYARFRIDTQGGLIHKGFVIDGEVEDYQVEIKRGELPPSPPPPPPPPLTVGGDVYPVNKMSLLIPWIALAVAIIALGILLVRRRAHH